ncbi:ISAs1 family transposase, partial [Actinocrinis puniceicyclus]
SVITMDALHTQRETARHLREHDAHYVFTVKANQPALLTACHQRITVDEQATGEHHESERTRGTIRERHLTTADAEGIDFPGAKQIARIIRYTRRPGIAGRLTKEVVYVITSLPPELAGPGDLAALVRGHWRIENQCHYVRDVTFGEDKSAISTATLPRIMATLRNLVISMLRLGGETNIAKALRRHARRPELLTGLLHLT